MAAAAVLGCDRRAVAVADIERLPAHPGIIRTLRESFTPSEVPGTDTRQPAPSETQLAIRGLRRGLGKPDKGRS